jgi:Tfp pilus assembly protein PilN
MRAVNLIPTEQRSGSAVAVGRSEGAAYAVLIVLAGVAVLAFLYGRADRQISSRRAQAATLTAQAQLAQAEASRLTPFTNFVALRERRMQAVSTLVDSRFDWAHAFHEFGRVLPADVSVSSLTGTISSAASAGPVAAASGPAAGSAASASGATPAAAGSASAASTVTSATPPGSVPAFTITGCATSQPTVALMLNRLRLIDGVSNVTLQSSTKAAGSGAASGGGCGAGQPAYSVQITFDAIPTPATISSTTSVVRSNGGSTTSPGGAR